MLGMVPGVWGSAGGTAEVVLWGVVTPKIPPTLLLANPSPSWPSGLLLGKLWELWLSPYHPHCSTGHSKGSAFAPWQWCPHPKGRLAAIRGCSGLTMA